MLKMFYPDEYVNSTYSIDFKKIYNEGYRGIIFDIDNTLVEHGKDANKRAESLFKYLNKLGFRTCLLSNNDCERVERFNKNINTNYIFKAGKPSNKGYKKAMKLMNTNLNNTIFIGDQIFTDVFGAKKMKMRNILVKPISKREEIQIVVKRYLEKIVLYFYKKDINKYKKII